MFNYDHAKQNVFAIGNIPDGYNGSIATVEFAFDLESGKTFALRDTPRVFFTYHTPLAIDASEAYWLLQNHPTSNVSRLAIA